MNWAFEVDEHMYDPDEMKILVEQLMIATVVYIRWLRAMMHAKDKVDGLKKLNGMLNLMKKVRMKKSYLKAKMHRQC